MDAQAVSKGLICCYCCTDPDLRPQPFPLELIVTVSEFLAGDDAFQTLASVNVASKSVKEATLPVLYHAVIWEDGKDHWSYDDLAMVTSRYFPSGWQHTRYVYMASFP